VGLLFPLPQSVKNPSGKVILVGAAKKDEEMEVKKR